MSNCHRLGFRVPCLAGEQGAKIRTYSANVRVADIPGILGHDPRSSNWKHLPQQLADIYKRNQRVTVADRQRKIEDYIRRRMGNRGFIGAFPAISLGFQFTQPFEEADEGAGFGSLSLTTNGLRIVIDGLGRITGCLNVIDQHRVEDLALAESLYLPVVFFMPKTGGELTVEDLGQLFADFNTLLLKVPPKLATTLDRTNLYVHGAEEVGRESFIADFHPELTDPKHRLVDLQKAVRCACEGPGARKQALNHKSAHPNLTDENYDAEIRSLIAFFGQFADRLGAERWSNKDGLHITAVGLQALASIHFQMRHPAVLNFADRNAVLDVLASVDWNKNNEQWQRAGILVAGAGGMFNLERDAAGLLTKYLGNLCFQPQLPLMPEASDRPPVPGVLQ